MAEQAEFPPIDPSTIAPLTGDGRPDLYNNLPSRLVSLAEARARGWPQFYDTSVCRYGHMAPRYVSNPRLCVDCHRLKNGRPTIGAKAGGTPDYKRPYKQREQIPNASPIVVAPSPVEPDKAEKKFLEAYAHLRNFDEAAKTAGMTTAQVLGRLSYSAVFRAAVNELEDRLGVKRTPTEYGPYEWTPEKRARFIQVYVDTGNTATARDAIVVTPSEYYAEIERNTEFADAVRGADPLAAKALEERAIQMALAGNDKLLTKVLSAKMPEYRERLDLNVRNPEKLNDQQLDNRLTKLLAKFGDRIIDRLGAIDVEYEIVEPKREAAALTDARSDRAGREQEPNSDLL